MKLLITGLAGFVGSVLTSVALGLGHSVRGLDRLCFGVEPLRPYLANPRFELVRGDIRDAGQVRRAVRGVDAVIHLAALVGVPACQRDTREAWEVNVEGARTLDGARPRGVPLILASTGSVYGEVEGICTEDTEPNPLSVYARTKYEAERILRDRGALILRFATGFGLAPRLRLDLLPNAFCYQAVHEGKLNVYEGRFRRSFIHVFDMARALILGLDHYAEMVSRPLNVGDNALNTTKLELAQLVARRAGASVSVDERGHDQDQRDYEVDYRRIREAGFRTTVSLAAGIDEMVRVFMFLKEEGQWPESADHVRNAEEPEL